MELGLWLSAQSKIREKQFQNRQHKNSLSVGFCAQKSTHTLTPINNSYSLESIKRFVLFYRKWEAITHWNTYDFHIINSWYRWPTKSRVLYASCINKWFLLVVFAAAVAILFFGWKKMVQKWNSAGFFLFRIFYVYINYFWLFVWKRKNHAEKRRKRNNNKKCDEMWRIPNSRKFKLRIDEEPREFRALIRITRPFVVISLFNEIIKIFLM